jgi:hypothetical protein
MLRRWRAEIAAHESDRYGWTSGYRLAPLPPDPDGDCHCYRGPGYFRKRTPFGCRCGKNGMCGIGKWTDKARRGNVRRAAIQFELEAEGSIACRGQVAVDPELLPFRETAVSAARGCFLAARLDCGVV